MIALILGLVGHFIADFLLQSREMGKKKSSDKKILAAHIAIQVAVVGVLMLLVTTPLKALAIALLNGAIHGVVDWNIWNLYKMHAYKRILKNATQAIPLWNEYSDKVKADIITKSISEWQYWEDHWFYTTIGFDQLLHTLTLVVVIGFIA